MVDDNVCDKKRLRMFIRNVRQEILNMKAGESKFRTGAIHFETSVTKAQPPVIQRLDVLDEHPSQKNLDIFLELAKQDLGARAGQAFTSWSTGIFTEDPEEAKKPRIKTFEQQITDGFYDLFKAAQIPLNPKQVDLITTHSGKLARTFQGEIHATVKEQLTTLVTKLKTNETPKEKMNKKDIVNTGSNSASGYE